VNSARKHEKGGATEGPVSVDELDLGHPTAHPEDSNGTDDLNKNRQTARLVKETSAAAVDGQPRVGHFKKLPSGHFNERAERLAIDHSMIFSSTCRCHDAALCGRFCRVILPNPLVCVQGFKLR